MRVYVTHTSIYMYITLIKDTDRRGHMYAPTHDAQACIPSVHPWRDMTWRDFPFHYITLPYIAYIRTIALLYIRLDYITPHYTPFIASNAGDTTPWVSPNQLRAPDCDALLRHQLCRLDRLLRFSSRIPRRWIWLARSGPSFKTRSTE